MRAIGKIGSRKRGGVGGSDQPRDNVRAIGKIGSRKGGGGGGSDQPRDNVRAGHLSIHIYMRAGHLSIHICGRPIIDTHTTRECGGPSISARSRRRAPRPVTRSDSECLSGMPARPRSRARTPEASDCRPSHRPSVRVIASESPRPSRSVSRARTPDSARHSESPARTHARVHRVLMTARGLPAWLINK